jgi:DNA-binding IclR family transcriptional regulator
VRAQPEHRLAAARDARAPGARRARPADAALQRRVRNLADRRRRRSRLARAACATGAGVARETRATVSLAVAKLFNLVYVDQVDEPRAISPNWLGRPLPLHATSGGKVFLAWLSKEERDALLPSRLERYTATTVTARRRLEQELITVRGLRYSSCLGELDETLFGVSAAVLSQRERPVAIVNVWGPSHRFAADRLADVGRRTVQAADEIRSLIA